ncbi:MAG TPA: fimbrial assembly protein FimA [Actinobacteria bacterium]|nr:fimbrial assembly protein FimA [Actinomycetota bacterium]
MTFSIVGCDLERGDWGVAVASKFPAVGAVVPWAKAGIGAVATQSYANTDFGPDGLRDLAAGGSAEDVLRALVEADDERDQRQVGMVDAAGRGATFTGAGCTEWAGGKSGEGFACQGNILVGPEVVEAMVSVFPTVPGELADRLLAALEAGDAAGGDRRGRQSAALLVVRAGGGYGGRNDRYIDLRVDDHQAPVHELHRLFDLYDRQFLIRNDPLLEATPELISDLQLRLAVTGHYQGEPNGELDDDTRKAVSSFAGQYNLEEKIDWDQGGIYDSVVREIRDLTPEVRSN